MNQLLTRNENQPYSDDATYYFSIPNNSLAVNIVESILTLPYEYFVEGILSKPMPKMRNEAGFLPDITLSITTSGSYKIPISQVFASAIIKKFNITNTRKDDITTCLQEAINNAIIHGNLQVQNNFKTAPEFETYNQNIKQRLADDTCSKRRINIAAWNNHHSLEIAVSDEGNGFELKKMLEHNPLPTGRGLALIHALTDKVELKADQRTLMMSFSY
jgi:anti-sigma regulatory factor (Ser/Thr protein kinase)